ncbi:Protein of unknown function [Gryllus bimaculatus]|nr:Protein of unknown function [Gryllus bimaculatus]
MGYFVRGEEWVEELTKGVGGGGGLWGGGLTGANDPGCPSDGNEGQVSGLGEADGEPSARQTAARQHRDWLVRQI